MNTAYEVIVLVGKVRTFADTRNLPLSENALHISDMHKIQQSVPNQVRVAPSIPVLSLAVRTVV